MDFNNTGTMRSPFSPRVRQSITGRRPIGLSSAKKNQSKFMQSASEQTGDVIYKTPSTTLVTYGQPLPVMVTEALTFASGEVSVRLSPCGWCCVVSGRRILVWPRSLPTQSDEESPAPAGMLAARELTLPQTDLAHKADLVVLFYEDDAQMPSCIGVSPEGIVRYWPSVGQEGVYVDVSAELAGQECERLGEYSRMGLALATTSCTVVMINPTVVDGRATVTCRTLRPPSGWLGGLGRRVSLLFFGSMPTQADTKLVGVVVVSESLVALVSGGPALQLWRDAELHEHSLRRALAAPLAPHGDLNSLEIVALDVRAGAPGGLLLLLAAVNVARSPEVRYAIAHICVQEPSSPRVTSLAPLRSWPQPADEAPRFLPLAHRALLYTSRHLAVLSTSLSNDKVEYIDVSLEGDRILGAELCGGVPLVFSRKHGVLALATSDAPRPSLCESPLGSPCPSDMYDGNLSLYEIDPHEVSLVTSDACGKLKTAFLFHLRRDVTASRALLEELFPSAASPPPASPPPSSPSSPSSPSPPSPPGERDVDAVLDRTVLSVAREMLDDVPAGDPRWAGLEGGAGGVGGARVSLGGSGALHAAGQLRDKQRAFSLFLDFLRAAGLWRRLGLVTPECGSAGCVSTESELGALGEQLVLAAALARPHHDAHAQLIHAAVYQVVCSEESSEEAVCRAVCAGVLSARAACFRRVTRVRRVLRALARPLHAPAEPHAAAARAAAALQLLATVLSEAQAARAQWGGAVRPAQDLLPPLIQLIHDALTQHARACSSPVLHAQLSEGAASLAGLLLADAALLPHQYHHLRNDIIRPFVEEGQLERAAALADKFKDFDMLIEICLKLDDMDRLYGYMDKYADEGMPEIAFARLADSGGAGRSVLARMGAHGGHSGQSEHAARARRWLDAAPGRAPLLALQQLGGGQLLPAARTLADLAAAETDSVGRMTTMASLAKLCLVASDEAECDPPEQLWRRVETSLALGEQHAALPSALRLHHGLARDDSRVHAPEELVQMYIESESTTLTEYDFKKALDLPDYITDIERRDDLRLQVWCASILRSDWARCRADEPDEDLRQLLFCRLLDLVHMMGGELQELLPPLPQLLAARALQPAEPRRAFLLQYCLHTLHPHLLH